MKSKGFTLVELIAVVIIIGVLLLIIIPNVANTLKKSEIKTFTASAKGVLRAATDYYASDEVIVTESECIDATAGIIKFDKDYQITGGEICYIDNEAYLDTITNGKYCATGNNDDLKVEICK